MPVPLHIRRARLALALASVVAVSSTAIGAGVFPALAQGDETTVVTETEFVPTETVATEEAPPVVEIPTVAPAPQAPIVTQEPQAPVVTEQTPAPVVTQEPEVVSTPAAPVTTSAAAPVPTPTTNVTTEVTTAATTPTTAATTSGSSAATTSSCRYDLGVDDPGSSTPGTSTSGTSTSGSTSPSESAALQTSSTTATTSGTGGSTSEGSTTESGETSSSGTTAGGSTEKSAEGGTTGGSTVEDTGSIEQAAGVTTTPEPQRLEAAPEDIKIAEQAKPVEEVPPPAPAAAVDELRNLVLTGEVKTGAGDPNGANAEATLKVEAKVAQWQPDWVQYDKYYRPLIFNPYNEPLKLVYDVGGQPRIVIIEPLGSDRDRGARPRFVQLHGVAAQPLWRTHRHRGRQLLRRRIQPGTGFAASASSAAGAHPVQRAGPGQIHQ